MQSTNGPDLAVSQKQQETPAQQQQQPPQQQPSPPQLPSQPPQWSPHQQQWMAAAAMQYPAASMVMMQQQQHMMMYPHQYMAYNHPHYQHPQFQYSPYQQQQQPPQHFSQGQPGSAEDVKTLWIGDLVPWMDETYLRNCFAQTGEVSSAKVIRNKQTAQSEGYGFIEFYTRETAEKVLQSYNGALMPNANQPFRLNWASFSMGDKRSGSGSGSGSGSDAGSDLSIFVGDLAPDVNDAVLQDTFGSRYPSVKGAKVVIDSNTGRSKGYGFVRFGDENERSRAITEMNGAYCSSRPMRVGVATPKKAVTFQQYSSQAVVLAGGQGANGSMAQGTPSDGESTNATIFVGGLDSDVTDEDLRQPFSEFGEVVSVKIPLGKGCGFVQFANRKNAEDAIENLNGTVIGKHTVRLSWGRSPGYRQWNGGYNRGQSYNNYGYAAQNQDPGMYAGSAIPGAS